MAIIIDNPVSPDGTLLFGKQRLRLGNTHFARTDDGTQQMALDGRPAGAQLVIWNGSGDAGGDWAPTGAGSETTGAARPPSTHGWDSGAVGANNETDFSNGALLDVAGTYDTLSFWLQPKAYPNNANLQVQWRNDVGTVIGATLNIENYVVNMDLDVWQKVTIPIADFNLTGDVQVLRIVYKVGNQQHWIDDIELQASGGAGPYTFRVTAPGAPDPEVWHVAMLVLLLTAPQSSWNSDGFANILGGLENGLLLRQRRISDGEILWSLNSKDNVDLFGRYHPQESFIFADNNLLVGFMVKPGQIATVQVTDDEVLEFVVRDDLSSVSNIRAFLHYGAEAVEVAP